MSEQMQVFFVVFFIVFLFAIIIFPYFCKIGDYAVLLTTMLRWQTPKVITDSVHDECAGTRAFREKAKQAKKAVHLAGKPLMYNFDTCFF
ncbi:hypothetical protein SAOR_07080 [Salinisphaera orenii MK-B5]|uniref:Uncharacterized protein n=1 Tax=Salinisphaera orenii MK-B5 TaxID=856730 RepID=A0A423PQI9_9GAMM|nr:hypothetical protein SAOR_07080 [Salinisphaera orenii MK-B5]